MEAKGNVFDIQRYSIHDGEGIRTTVFLKGCPLRCKWCSNPESWKAKPQLFHSRARCIKCWLCTAFAGITKDTDGPNIEWDKVRNEDLRDIAKVCPSQAMQVKGKLMTVSEVMKIVESDTMFYKQSNGGVTVSGGEALKQPEFVAELFKACKAKDINTAIETAGYVSWKDFEVVIPYTDHFFFDVKFADSNLHKKFVDKPNERILDNLEKLVKAGASVTVRIPIIPDVNDNKDELEAIAQTLKERGVSSYELLAFHQYGKGKYKSCGIEYEFEDVEQMPTDKMEKIRESFRLFLKDW